MPNNFFYKYTSVFNITIKCFINIFVYRVIKSNNLTILKINSMIN